MIFGKSDIDQMKSDLERKIAALEVREGFAWAPNRIETGEYIWFEKYFYWRRILRSGRVLSYAFLTKEEAEGNESRKFQIKQLTEDLNRLKQENNNGGN